MDKQEKIFADGIMWQVPNDNAPDFVKGHMLINIEKFTNWANMQKAHASEKGWIKIDIKDSQNGTRYFELNTWKPKKVEDNGLTSAGTKVPDFEEVTASQDIPF